jgi:hypothetical protein
MSARRRRLSSPALEVKAACRPQAVSSTEIFDSGFAEKSLKSFG